MFRIIGTIVLVIIFFVNVHNGNQGVVIFLTLFGIYFWFPIIIGYTIWKFIFRFADSKVKEYIDYSKKD